MNAEHMFVTPPEVKKYYIKKKTSSVFFFNSINQCVACQHIIRSFFSLQVCIFSYSHLQPVYD